MSIKFEVIQWLTLHNIYSVSLKLENVWNKLFVGERHSLTSHCINKLKKTQINKQANKTPKPNQLTKQKKF